MTYQNLNMMQSIPKDCIEEVSHPSIKCEEGSCKVYFLNPSKNLIKKIQLDGCAVSNVNNQKCCDFLIRTSSSEHFVELKGDKIKEAIVQLSSSITQFKEKHLKLKSYAIHSNGIAKTNYAKQQKKFQKKYNCLLIIKRSGSEIPLY